MLGKTEGIVLRTLDYGEGNKILTVFTKEMGKLGMMAQGARKTKSRFSALSQPFIQAHFIFHTGKNLVSLNQGEILCSFSSIRSDLYKTAYASYLVELTDRLAEERKRSTVLYDLLFFSLKLIDQGKDEEVITRIFEIQILSLFGYKPILDRCSNCSSHEGPWFFSSREGGLLCHNCRNKDPYAFLLSEGVARLLQTFQAMKLEQLGSIQLKNETREQLKKALHLFMDEHLGIRLKSKNFLEQLEKMEQVIPRKEHNDAESAERKPGTGMD